MLEGMADLAGIRSRFTALAAILDERSWRLLAAAESAAIGRGGISAVSTATGVSRAVIRKGMAELKKAVPSPPVGRVRRRGGGRKKATERDPNLQRDLERLVEPVTRGDPESPLRWTCKSVRNLAGGAKHPSGERHHPVKRVLLLSVDTLRRDALQYYRPGAPPTPNLDRLAADGVVFRNAYSPAPWTLPAFASIMTGLSPWVHGFSWASIPTLADYFRGQGYLTAAIGLNGFLAEQGALARSFREYNVVGTDYADSLGIQILKGLMPRHRLADRVSSLHLTERSKAWIRSHRNEQFFLWVHYFDPHDPYAPPPAFFPEGHLAGRIGQWFRMPWTQVRAGYVSYSPAELAAIRALYEAEVRYVDDCIGSDSVPTKRVRPLQ
jgi:hypothetical protein